MPNMIDYVHWRGDLDFGRFPFNAVDGMVFSQLSYLPMDGLVPPPGEGSLSAGELAALCPAIAATRPTPERDITVSGALSVLEALAGAPRFRDCRLSGFVNSSDPDEEKQFSAFRAAFEGAAGEELLAVFRGTDASLVGWKEDLNMSLLNSVPAQRQAVGYLERAAAGTALPVTVAGHSKGGNLAVYAAAFCTPQVRERIGAVYCYDAPGFHPEVVQGEGYRSLRARIRSFVPQSSFVGMLFEHGVQPQVVKSGASGLLQHNLCSWEVARDAPCDGGGLTRQSLLVNGIIREWMGKIGEGRRRQFVEALYRILASAGAASVFDLGADWPQSASGIIAGIRSIDAPTKKLMGEILGDLFRTARENLSGIGLRGEVARALWDEDIMG